MTESGFERHLDSNQIAAYVDGSTVGPARKAIEMHLATCSECRSEVVEVGRVVRSLPQERRWNVRIPAAAAAVLALLWIGPRLMREASPPVHREEGVTTTVAPRVLAPVGAVDSVAALRWSSVPAADRYRARLFDADGTVIWQTETADTVAALPDSVRIQPGLPYFWRVESHHGFDRWDPSDLTEFVLRTRRRE